MNISCIWNQKITRKRTKILIIEVQIQYNLRNKNVPVNPPNKSQANGPVSSQNKVDSSKEIAKKKDMAIKEVEKTKYSFILENKYLT